MCNQNVMESGVVLNYIQDVTTNTFKKEGEKWYLDSSLCSGGKNNLDQAEMVANPDDLLIMMARKKNEVTLKVDISPFEDADVLSLVEICEEPPGGGYYQMTTRHGKELSRKFWLCDALLLVLGHLPEKIYVRRERGYLNSSL
jgi:hypothetical protein